MGIITTLSCVAVEMETALDMPGARHRADVQTDPTKKVVTSASCRGS